MSTWTKICASLSCPVTRGPVEILPLVMCGEEVKEGLIKSLLLDQVVGSIQDFRFNFRDFDRTIDLGSVEQLIASGQAPRQQTTQPRSRFLDYKSPELAFRGSWLPLENYLMVNDGTDRSAEVTFSARDRCEIIFLAHPWSGFAEVLVEGKLRETVNLFNPHNNVPRVVKVLDLPPNDAVHITIRPTGARAPNSLGHQVGIEGVRVFEPGTMELKYQRIPRLRNAEFRAEFFDLLKNVPAEGLALDYGGGRRQLEDPRYVNVEYALFDEPDVLADGMNLPFQANTFDLIYSTGVIEHLPNPLRAGSEMFRVLKPGGKLLVDFAFMQPVHSEGQHFFNPTIYGAQQIFRDFEIDSLTPEGNFSYMTDWIARTLGIPDRAAADDYRQFQALIKKFDPLIAPEKLFYAASAIVVRAHKGPSESAHGTEEAIQLSPLVRLRAMLKRAWERGRN